MKIKGTPKQTVASKIIRRRLSAASNRTLRDEDTASICLQMHSMDNGRAYDAPTMILLAGKDIYQWLVVIKKRKCVLMSHHTGTGLSTLPAHTMAFTPYMTLTTKSHEIIARVATFRARQCQGRGMRTRTAPRKANRGSSGCCISKTTEMGGQSKGVKAKQPLYEAFSHFVRPYALFSCSKTTF